MSSWGSKRSASPSRSSPSQTATSTSGRNCRMAAAMACPYTRYFSSNDRRTLIFSPAPFLAVKDLSPPLLLLGGRRSPYRVYDLSDAGVRGEHLDRTGAQRPLVQGWIEFVGEHQRQGVGVGHAHLPDQLHPVPVGQEGIDQRYVDPVQVYVAGVGHRARLQGHLQVVLLFQAHRQGLPKGVVMDRQQYALQFPPPRWY